MTLDTLIFFHQATIRLCGSLDIDKSLCDCAEYLKQYIPLKDMVLATYDKVKKEVLILAVTDKSIENWHKPIPISPRAHESMAALGGGIAVPGNQGKTYLFDQRKANIIGQEVDKTLGIRRSEAEIVMELAVDGAVLGVISFFAEGGEQFTKEHIRLLELLHDPFAVALANTLCHREVLRLKDLLADDNSYLKQELRDIMGEEIVGARYGLRNVMEMVRQVAPINSPVLLCGETGVGKELVANAIHFSSKRHDGPLVKVNCGAFVDNLLDSELFGHERGAFTGAFRSKRGRFERADGGTLFLDEVAELPLEAQIRLLRVLQDGIIERVGGTETIRVNVRIISATHRDLDELVKQGKFREDLLFRLNVFPIHIPPLRERKSDIPALVHHFIERKSREFNMAEHPVLAPGSLEKLMEYSWPGNVRELENIVERALIWHLGENKKRPLRFFPLEKVQSQPSANKIDKDHPPRSLDEIMFRHITETLKYTGGKIQGKDGAAKLLGIHPSTLRSRMEKLDIPFGRSLPAK